MQTLFLVLAGIIGLVVGFAGTYFTLVTKLQKRLESTKSKLGRAKSASEDTEALQFQLEAQKGETKALQARLEALEANHRTQLDELQGTQAATLAQLIAEKTALEEDLQSLRENAPALNELPPDQSGVIATLQARLLEMEQEHQATVEALQSQYQAEIESLQQSPLAPAVELEEPLAPDFVPPAIADLGETTDEEFIPTAEPAEATETEEEIVELEAVIPEAENWVDGSTEVEAGETAEQVESFEQTDTEEFSPFDAPPPEITATLDTGADLENWVDAPADSFTEETSETSLPATGFANESDLELELTELSSLETAEFLGAVEDRDDEFLAELTGEEQRAELPLFDEKPVETIGELEAFNQELSFTSSHGDDLNLPGDLLEDFGTDIQTPGPTTEEILPGDADGGADGLDFLLELQTGEPEMFPGQGEEELLPDFSAEESISMSFTGMEMLTEQGEDFPDLLGANPETHGGDPFINILDEDPNASDNDLLALLQTDEGGADQPRIDQGEEDDLFPSLVDMLGEDAPSDGGELDDLDALLGDTNLSGSSGSLDDFDFGPENP
ncbi:MULTISPECIES: hypothetical protein [unclassified Synechocystis]|uniref:hypothetical protein n=1 Tax=unclassified Synechocystis TaxID=2640012 RepID=UPI0004027650|nr:MULTISPECIES: hypothetical protein [unclassified Synechocystis]AIE74615.1 hypothetical protein D082_20870 [Synechocystis sp. PCC 6714]MCT0254024.1 hypothetical protein [Synechocystis sp. CS-94]